MTAKEFVRKAIEGGWKYKYNSNGYLLYELAVNEISDERIESIFLDPLAWKAVEKQEMKADELKDLYAFEYENVNMHRMIDALVEGKSLEEFLETL